MKLLLISAVVGTSLLWADGTTRIGFVDLQKAMATVDSGKKAQAQLEKDVAAKKLQIEKQQKSLQEEAEKFEKGAALLGNSAKAAKQAELQKKFAEVQKFAGEAQMELQKRERDLTKPILDELRAIIEGIGKEKKYQLIVEKNEGGVLYTESGSDLTDQVIELFNKKKKS